MGLSFSRHATQCAEYIAEPRAERSAKKSSSRSDNSCLGGFSIFKSSNGKKAKIESHIVSDRKQILNEKELQESLNEFKSIKKQIKKKEMVKNCDLIEVPAKPNSHIVGILRVTKVGAEILTEKFEKEEQESLIYQYLAFLPKDNKCPSYYVLAILGTETFQLLRSKIGLLQSQAVSSHYIKNTMTLSITPNPQEEKIADQNDETESSSALADQNRCDQDMINNKEEVPHVEQILIPKIAIYLPSNLLKDYQSIFLEFVKKSIEDSINPDSRNYEFITIDDPMEFESNEKDILLYPFSSRKAQLFLEFVQSDDYQEMLRKYNNKVINLCIIESFNGRNTFIDYRALGSNTVLLYFEKQKKLISALPDAHLTDLFLQHQNIQTEAPSRHNLIIFDEKLEQLHDYITTFLEKVPNTKWAQKKITEKFSWNEYDNVVIVYKQYGRVETSSANVGEKIAADIGHKLKMILLSQEGITIENLKLKTSQGETIESVNISYAAPISLEKPEIIAPDYVFHLSSLLNKLHE